jgi:hypothetical protein
VHAPPRPGERPPLGTSAAVAAPRPRLAARFLRGELAAVEAYELVIAALSDVDALRTLRGDPTR